MSMVATNYFKNPILPISDSPIDEEEEKQMLLKRGEDKLFKGSSMTKRGAHAAVSYMSCAGTFPFFLFSIHFLSSIFNSLIAYFLIFFLVC